MSDNARKWNCSHCGEPQESIDWPRADRDICELCEAKTVNLDDEDICEVDMRSSFDLVGPFQEYRVKVEGRRVPLLSAHPIDGGQVNLVFDGTHVVLLDIATAQLVVPFIAIIIKRCLNYEFSWPIMMEVGEVEVSGD